MSANPTCQLSDAVTEVKKLSIYNPNTDQVCFWSKSHNGSLCYNAAAVVAQAGSAVSCKETTLGGGQSARVCAYGKSATDANNACAKMGFN